MNKNSDHPKCHEKRILYNSIFMRISQQQHKITIWFEKKPTYIHYNYIFDKHSSGFLENILLDFCYINLRNKDYAFSLYLIKNFLKETFFHSFVDTSVD